MTILIKYNTSQYSMYKASDLYFHKQGTFSNKCGQYALNNLLGGKYIDSAMLNQICDQFQKEISHNYKHAFGGDYDINVLIEALKIMSKDCFWLGSKQQVRKSGLKESPERAGYLINRKQKANALKELVGLSNNHWVAVRQYNGQFYLLDSKSQSNVAEHIINISKFLQEQAERESHIIEVVDTVSH